MTSPFWLGACSKNALQASTVGAMCIDHNSVWPKQNAHQGRMNNPW